jgi:hypothetical protein
MMIYRKKKPGVSNSLMLRLWVMIIWRVKNFFYSYLQFHVCQWRAAIFNHSLWFLAFNSGCSFTSRCIPWLETSVWKVIVIPERPNILASKCRGLEVHIFRCLRFDRHRLNGAETHNLKPSWSCEPYQLMHFVNKSYQSVCRISPI